MAPNETATRPLVECSFCNKGDSEVKKIIAGPGVYICNECIGLCNDLIERETSEEDAKRQREQFLRPSAEMLLTRVRGLSRTMEGMEADLRRWVSQARQEFGVDWQRIAVELDATPEAVRERFREP